MDQEFENVILITIDSLRRDFVSYYDGSKNTTPFIDSLAREGIAFCDAVSTSSHTKDSFPGIFSSKLPSVQNRHHIHPDSDTLATMFSNHDYYTAGFHSTPMMSVENNYDKGFEEFHDLGFKNKNNKIKYILNKLPNSAIKLGHEALSKFITFNDITTGRAPANEITNAVLNFLKANKTPFFLFAHYMDPHAPYTPPRKYQIDLNNKICNDEEIKKINSTLMSNKNEIRGEPKKVSDEILTDAKNLYSGSVRFADQNIKKIYEHLNNVDLLDETLIIITSDHGEEFLEHGGFFHGQKLYEELINVPLIMSHNSLPSLKLHEQVSLLDLAPTLAGMYGWDRPEFFDGNSFYNAIVGESYTTEYAFSETTMKRLGADVGKVISCRSADRHKIIYNEQSSKVKRPEYELYNIVEDKEELSNIYRKDDEIPKSIKINVDKLVEKGDISSEERVDNDTKSRLESLGYLD